MAVLITGGTGFIGLNVSEALLRRGETVVVAALDELPRAAREQFAELPGRLIEERLDILNSERMVQLMRDHQVDRLLPFAAVTSGPERESEMPERVIEVNLVGFIAQLRAARDAGVKRVIAPASGAVYGESYLDRDVVDESTACFPSDIYGVTKFAVERVALRLAQLWSMDLIVARIAGTFGPWERDTGLRDFITPHWRMARLAVNGGVAVLPTEIPPCSWTYSRDMASGLVHLLDLRDPPYRVFNVSSGLEWGQQIRRWPVELERHFPAFRWRQSSQATEVNVGMPDTKARARMDISRLRETGWAPRYTPELAYEDYADWVRRTPEAL